MFSSSGCFIGLKNTLSAIFRSTKLDRLSGYVNINYAAIEAVEMRFLRPMAGYTLWDKKRSSDIREQLGIFNINDKLTQYKINWSETYTKNG